MAGTIYATKEELTEAVVKLVYPNTTKSVTALGNQTAILNVVESLWAQLGGGGTGGCTSEVFTSTTNGATITLTRTICGSSVSIKGVISNNEVRAAKRCDLVEVISQGYGDFRWFRMTNFTCVQNIKSDPGNHGYLELTEVSSYQSGVSQTDKTLLHLAGWEVGTLRTYNVDSYDFDLGPIARSMDNVDNDDTSTYIESSPLDLSISGFNVSYITPEQAVIDGHTIATPFGSINSEMSFMIKGELL